MTNDLLLNAYRFHRSTTRTARKWGIPSRNPAWDALNLARADVAAGKTRYPRDHFAAVCWQPVDADSPSYARRAERLAFVQNVDGAGLRHVGNVEAECGSRNGFWSNRDSCGWYSDNDQQETIYGVVYQLTGRDGKARFVAGYASAGDCDGLPTLDFGTIYSEFVGDYAYRESATDIEAARDAARAADSMAQHAAETERDYQAAWQAGSRFAGLAETIAANRKAALELLSERRRAASVDQGATYQAICKAIRDKVESLLEAMSEARTERGKLKAGDHINEWLPGFWTGDKRLQAAFNDGAGESIFSV
ncbi:hypothetical protein [Mesorhizobium sp. INR15]|uniref:hypothetical protein n=1 Tax=Mesorhizobium sp. INR15 TaxID=2654248 RepID=UPI001896668E|nr:hypothetical protein [Mesorhizobium sp. INR15]QPC91490.1 hypothetical protein GA829_13195 [Mesorhizobium sp. INR15]